MSATLWNLLVFGIVLVTMVASGALPVAAMRQWPGYWKLVAALPLLALAAWVAIIMLARAIDPESHRLWLLELFGWAMLTMIYMVIVFTARRAFEKADKQEQLESRPGPGSHE